MVEVLSVLGVFGMGCVLFLSSLPLMLYFDNWSPRIIIISIITTSFIFSIYPERIMDIMVFEIGFLVLGLIFYKYIQSRKEKEEK